jgi:myo-inositol-1(or 4)-monophosphatase
MSQSMGYPDNSLLAEIEALAVEIARGGGAILGRYFGSTLEIEYKDEKKTDPVTVADKESQTYLADAISERFPDHGILGEEDEDEDEEGAKAPDFVWLLDPLDGTKNFLNGLPVYACSIGVLHRGEPVAGAIYLPWPGEAAGVVAHARKGGGAFVDGEPTNMPDAAEPVGNRLVSLPASFGATFQFSKPMDGKVGELRTTGSIAYEMAMVARGVLQYALTGAPRLWDVAGGAALVKEAGGVVMVGRRAEGRNPLMPSRLHWGTLDSFISGWDSGTVTLKDLRRWSAPMVAGSPGIARYVTGNAGPRSSLRRRLSRALRGRGR